ncbi:MAG: alpha-N-acetylglucosaminidase, partial [Muribaculaceae bacterium]|nr:alpha-N-acetylglucosaminidase [Muribaculaceae bacterium]
MKRIVFLLAVAVMVAANAWAADADVLEAQALAARLSSRLTENIKFEKIKSSKKGTDVYSLVANVDGSITIGGSNANAMAVGLNHYLKKYCNTTVSWYADVPVELPEVLPKLPESQMVTSTVPQRFFLNYCTYGYTMAF